jgi:cytochrome b
MTAMPQNASPDPKSNFETSPERNVLVWDAATRMFHWLTAALLVAAYVTWRLDWMNWHARAGEAVLALVIFRVLWGFFGSATARFAGFVASPRVAVEHLALLLRREPDRQVGHNPAGGWMVLILLALLLLETFSGLYVNNDIADEGPLTELTPAPVANAINAVHWIFWDVLLAAIALHLAAVVIYATAKGQNLVTPMITGWKVLPATVPQPRLAGPLRAWVLIGVSALAVALLAAAV